MGHCPIKKTQEFYFTEKNFAEKRNIFRVLTSLPWYVNHADQYEVTYFFPV